MVCDVLYGRYERVDTAKYQQRLDRINKGTFELPKEIKDEWERYEEWDYEDGDCDAFLADHEQRIFNEDDDLPSYYTDIRTHEVFKVGEFNKELTLQEIKEFWDDVLGAMQKELTSFAANKVLKILRKLDVQLALGVHLQAGGRKEDCEGKVGVAGIHGSSSKLPVHRISNCFLAVS